MEEFSTADLIDTIERWKKHLGSLWSQRYFSLMPLSEEGNLLKRRTSGKDGCKLRLQKLLPFVTFCVWSGKSQRISKSDVCDNHVRLCSIGNFEH